MEITFSFIRSKEVINLFDGKRLGRIVDVSFERETGKILGFIVPAIKKLFKKNEDIFIPVELVKKIGDDVILVRLAPVDEPAVNRKQTVQEIKDLRVYGRYRRMSQK